MKIIIRRAKNKRRGRHHWVVTEDMDQSGRGRFDYVYVTHSFEAAIRIADGLLTDGKVFVEDIIDVSAVGSRRWGR